MFFVVDVGRVRFQHNFRSLSAAREKLEGGKEGNMKLYFIIYHKRWIEIHSGGFVSKVAPFFIKTLHRISNLSDCLYSSESVKV